MGIEMIIGMAAAFLIGAYVRKPFVLIERRNRAAGPGKETRISKQDAEKLAWYTDAADRGDGDEY
jgi:hypothetical protein